MIRPMRHMRRLLAFAVLGAFAVSGTALANHLDPQKKITPADQARARAMLVKKADFGLGVQAIPNAAEPHVTCRGMDQSDLILTGEAQAPSFVRSGSAVSSTAEVYRTVRDSRVGWARFTGAAGARCLEEVQRREYAKQGFTLQSFRKLNFPRIGQATVAFRVILSGESQGVTVPFTLDLVALLHSRAQAGLVFGSLAAPARAEEVRLARLVAKRMATAMRG